LLTRKALDWTKRFPTIAAGLKALNFDKALLDLLPVATAKNHTREICILPLFPATQGVPNRDT
jgi:ATP-dependent DNA ligase